MPERYAAVADHLQERHRLKPLLLGGPGEEALLYEVEQHMRTPALSTAEDVLDLDALKSAVKRLSILVTSDAGPRHYGVAFDVPTVGRIASGFSAAMIFSTMSGVNSSM